jgi:hypothetical protein
MKPLEPLLPGEMRSEYLARVDAPMHRARALVEAHISDYGMVPHPDKLKEAIAAELGLRKSGPDIAHADLCLLSRVFHQRDFPISLDASCRINEWLKAQIAAASPPREG